MKILYIAKHDSGGNDDEGAIYDALLKLGHEVERLRESKGHLAPQLSADVMLFHHWFNPRVLELLQGKMLRCFWNFDLVEWPKDPTLWSRNATRVEWMRETIHRVDLGFCTDGNWAANHRQLINLMQGADQRLIGTGTGSKCPTCNHPISVPPILYTGIGRAGGQERMSFVEEMKERWGDRFNHVDGKVYRQNLKDMIAGSQIVVAPDSPVTDLYWSNRVYVMLGYGAFLLHPWSKGLAEQYRDGEEIVYYHSRKELHALIEYWLTSPKRSTVSKAGLRRTEQEHTYLHRCKTLVDRIKRIM